MLSRREEEEEEAYLQLAFRWREYVREQWLLHST